MATPKNKNSEYWQKRFKAIENRSHNKGLKSLAYIALEYEKAEKELNDKIVLWYERFAKNNDITLAEAKKMLTAKELKEFQWTVEEYIKYAEENALNQKWIKELENASARAHIERFEALKLDMKATIEKLYAVQNSTLSKTLGGIYSDTYYRSCFEIQKAFGVGWNVSKVSENKLKNTLSTPWATDGSNFSSRLWNNREKLVSEVQNIVTRGIMTGKAPDKMTDELYKTMGSSKRNAGRVIMTETAAISAMSQNDAYEELGVEEFEIIETLDGTTCEVCGELDGKHFPKSEYKIGVTVPPFHPWCRGCTAPYFEDMKGISTRFARDVKTGKAYEVPNDMTFAEWKKKQDEKYGEGTVDTVRKMSYNNSADKSQYDKYKQVLGKEAPKKFDDFRNIKYFEPEKYAAVKIKYANAQLQNRIKSGKINTTVLQGKQGKHIKEHNNFIEGRSYLNPNEDVQALVNKYAGTGEILRDGSNKWNNKEVVKADYPIGFAVSQIDGTVTETSTFIIHYSKKGVHIVPKKE